MAEEREAAIKNTKSKRKSIINFAITCIILGIIGYTAVLFFVISSRLKKGMNDNYKEELIELSKVLPGELSSELESVENTSRWLNDNAQKIMYSGTDIGDNLNHLIESAITFFKMEKIAFYDSEGRQISSSRYGTITRKDLIAKAVSGSSFSDLIMENSQLYAVSLRPIILNGKIYGATAVMTCAASDELMRRVSNFVQSNVTIFEGDTRIFTSLEGMKNSVIADPTPVRSAEKDEPAIVSNVINGIPFLSYYYPVYSKSGDFLAVMFIGKPLSIINTVAQEIFIPLFIIASILTVLLIALIFSIMMRRIKRPLNNVEKAVAKLSSGDADLTYRLDVKGNDEFAALASDVNTFIDMLQNIVKDLNAAQVSLVEVSDSLGSNSQQSASATAQIMANIAGVRKQSENQSKAVDNTTEVLAKSSESVRQLGDLIDNQAAGITESSAAIEQMLGNISAVSNSVRKMSESFNVLENTVESGNTKLVSVDQKVKDIAEQSTMLLQANAIIAQIASETNLLAMNAAIEAAHAGEAGGGFSVVASEIRKLAETSSQQTKTIGAELKGISASIQEVVSLSRDSQTAFGEIISHIGSTDTIIREIDNAMSEQENASRQILDALNDMKTQSVEVREKSQEMGEGVKTVAEYMGSVAQISSTILGSMDEMNAGASQISSASQNVSELASETRNDINIMNEKLNQFKV